MDSSLDGTGFDQLKCNKMSVEEKRLLIYELSKQSHLASEVLQTWSRQEILQILCVEMGKERKYTGLTKVKIIETLLKIISDKNYGDEERKRDLSPNRRNSKRQRKADNPSRVIVPSGTCNSLEGEHVIYCKNSACRAVLKQEDKFCRRCSCCICHKYDDNKDPSLWLTCGSDPPFADDSCGQSCHLECAFKHEKSGLEKDKRNTSLDGCFYCVSCGKTNDLLECWKKQLIIAKETRRVDVLCYRLFLIQKLLKGSKKYQKLFEFVDEAVKNLEDEIGPLTGHPMKMGRGIVNRLHSGPEVQKLCSSALESLEKIPSDVELHPSQRSKPQDTLSTGLTKIRFEDIRATSLTIVLSANESSSSSSSSANIVHYSIWHRKITEKAYRTKSTCTLFTPNTRFVVSGLISSSEYCFKVVSFSGTRELQTDEIKIFTRNAEEEEEEEAVNCSSVLERSESPLTNCSSVEAESNDYMSYCKKSDEINVVVVPKNGGSGAGGGSPSSEDNNTVKPDSDIIQIEMNNSSEEQMELKEVVPENRPDIHVPVVTDLVGNRNNSETSLPITPFRNRNNSDLVGNRNNSETSFPITPFRNRNNSDLVGNRNNSDLVGNRNNSETSLPITPFRSDQIKNRQGRTAKSKDETDLTHREIAIESRSKQKADDVINGDQSTDDAINGGLDRSFELCVKIIRQLECLGHIEKRFRQKFLTWYSLKARPQEIRVVKIFIDTFMDDPSALAEQLMDTFSDCVLSKRSAIGGASAVVPSGFCMKLWH